MDQERDQGLIFQIDGVPFRVREKPDLSWLPAYGRVFRVFDGLLSGNLCFRVEGKFGRLFIKYAGASPMGFTGHPRQAVETLKNAMPLYQRSHPALTQLLGHGPTKEGYAAIFVWQEAQALYEIGPSPALRLVQQQPWAASLKMLDSLIDLHVQLAEEGYVAVDLSEDNLLIDRMGGRAILCDIDLYRKKPARNDRGKMPGSPRMLAPEEYQLDAPLNDATTVYHLGALAFSFFGDVLQQKKQAWHGPACLFPIAQRACSPNPEKRYPTVRAFQQAWRDGVAQTPLLSVEEDIRIK